jgi:hypothetical protein
MDGLLVIGLVANGELCSGRRASLLLEAQNSGDFSTLNREK